MPWEECIPEILFVYVDEGIYAFSTGGHYKVPDCPFFKLQPILENNWTNPNEGKTKKN